LLDCVFLYYPGPNSFPGFTHDRFIPPAATAPADTARLAGRIEKLKQCFALCGVINSTLDLPVVLDRS
jgi:hypothetical protein